MNCNNCKNLGKCPVLEKEKEYHKKYGSGKVDGYASMFDMTEDGPVCNCFEEKDKKEN
jgi:hypothetical protein